LSDGWKKKYIEMFGSFMEPFKCLFTLSIGLTIHQCWR